MDRTDTTNGANHFARQESVYDYLRPRRTSSQQVFEFVIDITCWQKERLPSQDQEAHETYGMTRRLSG